MFYDKYLKIVRVFDHPTKKSVLGLSFKIIELITGEFFEVKPVTHPTSHDYVYFKMVDGCPRAAFFPSDCGRPLASHWVKAALLKVEDMAALFL